MKTFIFILVILTNSSWASECPSGTFNRLDIEVIYPKVEFNLGEKGTYWVPITQVAIDEYFVRTIIDVGTEKISARKPRFYDRIDDLGRSVIYRTPCDFKATVYSQNGNYICERTMYLKACF